MQLSDRSFSVTDGLEFDLVVVGAGINGCGIAWEAALRGLSVLLIDRDDFGGHTSAGAFKIIHGGLRYLMHGELERLFRSAKEQKILRDIAPHYCRPIPFLVPIYNGQRVGKGLTRLGTSFYDLLTFWRNFGINRELALPRSFSLSPLECLQEAPGLVNANELAGGVVFHDCQITNCERFTFSVARSAELAGAKISSHLELVEAEQEKILERPYWRLSLLDRLTDKRISVLGRVVVNSCGPWNRALWAVLFPEQRGIRDWTASRLSKGLQLVLPSFGLSKAVALNCHLGNGRFQRYLLAPWNGVTLAGTTEESFEGNPAEFSTTPKEILRFLSQLETAYNFGQIEKGAVRHAFGGLRMSSATLLDDSRARAANSDEVSREDLIINHASNPPRTAPAGNNVISVFGVKYTTFRELSARVVNQVEHCLGKQPSLSRTSSAALYNKPSAEQMEEYKRRAQELLRRGVAIDYKRLICNYGTDTDKILSLIGSDPDGAKVLCQVSGTTVGELHFAMGERHTHTVADLIHRRLPIGAFGYPGEETWRRIELLVGSYSGHSEKAVSEEMRQAELMFPLRRDGVNG